MTGVIRWNKSKTPAGSDGWNLTPDIGTSLDSANVIVPVATDAERDALTPPTGRYAGMFATRPDIAGMPLERYNGSAWSRDPVLTTSAITNDGNWTITGGLIRTVTTGLTQVTASLLMVRSNAIGSTVSPAGNTIIIGAIPSGFRPPGNFSMLASVTTGSDARYAEPEIIVNNGGSIVGRSVSGGDITISQTYKLYITGTWYV